MAKQEALEEVAAFIAMNSIDEEDEFVLPIAGRQSGV